MALFLKALRLLMASNVALPKVLAVPGSVWTVVIALVTSVMTVTYGVAVQRRSLD